MKYDFSGNFKEIIFFKFAVILKHRNKTALY